MPRAALSASARGGSRKKVAAQAHGIFAKKYTFCILRRWPPTVIGFVSNLRAHPRVRPFRQFQLAFQTDSPSAPLPRPMYDNR